MAKKMKKLKVSHFTKKGPARPSVQRGIPGGPSGGNNNGVSGGK